MSESGVNFLVVGLGSMGKRRVRNLQALGHVEIAGYDPRLDRREEAAGKYGIRVFETFEAGVAQFEPAALVISTDPLYHADYAFAAADLGIHCFTEASVVDANRLVELGRQTEGSKLVMAPSCTMRYFPGPRAVKELIRSGAIGDPINLNYHTGQYLPDWHPWEDIKDFYVSRPETGACREIVPFELTWLNDVFGDPEALSCVKARTGQIDAEIDDVYHFVLRYPNGMLANITVEVLSRPCATRELRVLGSEGQIVFRADEDCVRHIRLGETEWTRIALAAGTPEPGYISPEEPYVSEMADFVRAIEHSDPMLFPNSLESDARVLGLLSRLETLSVTSA